jgi:membrane-bound serine protease (ClpP class)
MNLLFLTGLFFIGLIAIIIEFFVPAAGIIGIIGGGCIIGSVVKAYLDYGILTGSAFLLGALILTPLLIMSYFKIFPKTIIGRKLILNANQSHESGFTSFTQEKYMDLKGRSGIVLKDLRPTGIVEIEGRKFNALTNGEYLDSGSKIQVFKVEGNRVFVKKAGSYATKGE